MITPSALEILELQNVKLHGQERVFANVNRALAAGDGMYKGNDAYYFEVGANALTLIYRALAAGGYSVSHVQRVLDYACGFGR